jgi:two-component system OmpR family sensor kinase
MPIRVKLAVWYSLLVIVILTLLAGIRYAGQQQLLQDQQDYSLKVVAGILDSSIPRQPPSKAIVQKAVTRMVSNYPDIELKGLIIKVYDASRTMVFSSSLSEKERLPLTAEMWSKALGRKANLVTMQVNDDAEPMRILTKPVYNQTTFVYLIEVGESSQAIDASLENSVLLNAVFIPTAVLLVSVGGWWLTRRALQPLDTMIQTAHRISSGDLSHRIDIAGSSEEIRNLGQAFNQMIERLESSFQQIRDFGDNVSHELRIPLSILRGQTELSLRRVRSEEEYRNVLESNLEEIQRMEKIVERLLFLSRAERGEINVASTQVDLRGLVASVVAQFAVAAEAKKLRLVPRSGGPVVVVGDELLLRELLMNLIQNAITYTPEGGDVAVVLDQIDGRVELAVADTGCGIPEGEIPHIFERFYQVDRSRSSQGSGLGLSICWWIVEAHGGEIRVESTVGKGSRFTVSLNAEH